MPNIALPQSLAGTYQVEAEAFFNARHFVKTRDGPGPIHNHFYRVQARCSGKWLDENQCLVGFGDLKRIMVQVLRPLNGQLLNDLPMFRTCQPTAETLVAVIYHMIAAESRDLPVTLKSMTLWETPTVSITFTPEPEPARA